MGKSTKKVFFWTVFHSHILDLSQSLIPYRSGDGTLSVIDPRAGSGSGSSESKNPGAKGKTKAIPSGAVEVSEDQEDELLSMAAVKGSVAISIER